MPMLVGTAALSTTRGDIPILAGLLGSQLGAGLKQIVQQTFQNKLP